MPLTAGQNLAHYQILGPLGSGGMGEVYRARDTRLEREVAIKVLPEELADDEERLRRFEREAKTLASLNHPNVAGIHGVDQQGEICFLALELVPGEDLATRLELGALPVEEALDVCRQIAEGLEAAHEAGVVHRDLKPANVRVTPEGVVKVLDFGLAKPMRETRSGTTAAKPDSFLVTEEGLLLGTPTYMAPEQARGKPVDRRADVWAFGCVLFECLSGKRAFDGESMMDVLAAVVDREPDWSVLPRGTPLHVRALIKRCLDKDPRRRLRDIGEARVTLTEGVAGDEEDVPATRGKGILAGAVALGIAAGFALGAVLIRRGEPSAGSPALVLPVAFRQISDLPGPEAQPCLAPDGKSVVYVSKSDGGDADVFFQRVEGRNPLNLTKDSPADDYAAAISPDGESIAFRSERDDGGVFVMGATGESVRRVNDFGHDPAWSPDGSMLALTTEAVEDPLSRDGISELWIVALDGSKTKLLTKGDAASARWSPDGRRIAYWGWRDPDWQRDLFTIAADGSETEGVLVTDDAPVDWNPVWARDGRSLFFGSNRGGTMSLWRIAVDPLTGRPQGAPVPLTAPSTWSGDFSLSADGSRIAYATRDEQTVLWAVDFDPETASLVGEPRRVFGGRALIDVAWASDGERLVLIQRGNPWESMAVIRSDGTGYTRISDASIQHRGPRWRPGGERILFYSNVTIMTVRSDGSGQRPISGQERSSATDWSADGQRILFTRLDEHWLPKELVEYAIDEDGASRSTARKFAPIEGNNFNGLEGWSPDERFTLWRGQADKPGLRLFDLETGEQQRLLPSTSPSWAARWLPGGKRLLIRDRSEIRLLDLETGANTLVHHIERDSGNGWGGGMSLTPDSRKLAFLEKRGEGDVWILELGSVSEE